MSGRAAHWRRGAWAALPLLGALVSFPIAAASATAGNARARHVGPWVTAWEAPAIGAQGVYVGPQPPTMNFPNGFANQTLRLIVTPHAAGSRARVLLSNLFGTRTITIAHATIAVRARGARLRPGTLRALTFGGHRTVRIRAGEQLLSDPAAIRVAPFRDLAVSLAFGASTGPPTYHYNGLQTSYLSAVGSGDHTMALGAGPFSATTPMRFFLTGVRVLAAPRARTLVAVGDSITDGGVYAPDTANRNTRWPDQLQRLLLAAHDPLSVANAGISANEITQPSVIPEGGPSLESRFRRDVLSQPTLAGIIVLEGINDIGLSNAAASGVIAGLKGIARRAHGDHVPIQIGTLLPFQGAFDYSPAKEQTREQVNQWIRHQHIFNGVIDFAAAVQDPADPLHLRPRFDSGDHLHPNAKGFKAMAAAVNAALSGLPARQVNAGARDPRHLAGSPHHVPGARGRSIPDRRSL